LLTPLFIFNKLDTHRLFRRSWDMPARFRQEEYAMDKALVNDAPMIAHPEAPATAVCPLCGHLVDLRRREDTWFWRHQPGGPLTCPAHPNNIKHEEMTTVRDVS
jgi:hypothetical protein